MSLSVVACAAGRPDLFKRHVESLKGCEYNIAIWGDAGDHIQILAEQDLDANVTTIPSDCWWPLPKAYNAALETATGDRLLIVGADIIADEGLLEWAASRTEQDVAWCFRVVNSDGTEFVGPTRRVAIPYCVTVSKAKVLEIGGWSGAFCAGTCYDDNDFAARLLMAGIEYRWCDEFENIHQKHERYGGTERAGRNEHNRQIWLHRLGKYKGPLWPVFWDDANPPARRGAEEQGRLREALHTLGYPRHGDYRIRERV